MTAIFGLGPASVVVLVFVIMQLHKIVLVWFAPRLYIVEWLLSQVQK